MRCTYNNLHAGTPSYTAYYAPTTTYYAPSSCSSCTTATTSYYAPASYVANYAPTTAYYAPYTTYYAPTTAYYAPAPYTTYYAPGMRASVVPYARSGESIYGTPKIYVQGEPLRNVWRAVSP